MKFIIYLECIVVFTLFAILRKVIFALDWLGTSAEWYCSRNLHPWQGKKALNQYNKEYSKRIEESIKKLNGE